MDLSELKKRLSDRRIFHAYIVTGSDGERRQWTGELIARAAVCSGAGHIPCGTCRDCVKALRGVHPDIETVEKSGREHTVDSMRAVRGRAGVMPNEAEKSVFIIADADCMNVQAQNAMLKVLEEPPEHAVFVLLADNPSRLLPTVRSRCETVSLPPEEPEEPECVDAAEEIIEAYMSGNDLALARALVPAEKLDRTGIVELIAALRAGAVRKAPREKFLKLTDTLDEAEKMAAANVNSGHISGFMLGSLCNIPPAIK